MKYLTHCVTLASGLFLIGCGGGSGDGTTTPAVSTGLKIFVTKELHNGDFANDPTLPGSTAIQKADAFCSISSSRPTNDNYKALIVDGVNRDAVALTDWVLRPNTSYYQTHDNVLVDVTTSTATFAAYYRSMPHSVLPTCPNCSSPGAWTGIGDGALFSSSGACSRWGQSGSIVNQVGTWGSPGSSGAFAFYSGGSAADCVSLQFALYCVQQ
jgi:hypothetical protein